MTEPKTNWEAIVSGNDVQKLLTSRSRTYVTAKRRREDQAEYTKDGWEEYKSYKDPKFVGVRKNKKVGELFEDRVWCILARMGFTHMNKDRSFIMLHNKQQTQQIDVFAADNETVIIVECKAAEKPKKRLFKKELLTLQHQMEGLRNEAKSEFPKAKVQFIWATQNYIISEEDVKRMNDAKIVHFDDAAITYYEELVNHLGTAARYQLQGNLFARQKIQNMPYKIPAIQSEMGGRKYYSFSIAPERLLQIAYVLHRSKANKEQMPTYQRLIKKKRLAEVRKFVTNKGYFPNSLIINIENRKNELHFDQSSLQCDDVNSKIGILHLPRVYHSAYIIDGQHRLYGYSGSEASKKDHIPVVAFVNLDPLEQVKLFKDINENQKAVPKTLRSLLDGDVLYYSDDCLLQRRGLRSRIAQMLGEEKSSPLRDRVVLGEDDESPSKCITIGELQSALNKCDFLTKYKAKNTVEKYGTFDTGNNDETCARLYPFIEDCLRYVCEMCSEEWERGNADDGVLTINRGIRALICVINDIVNHLEESKIIDAKNHRLQEISRQVCFYLDPLIEYLNNITIQERKELRKRIGGAGPIHFWRTFQQVIADKRQDFAPVGLKEHWEKQSKSSNTDCLSLLSDISTCLKNITLELLKEKYGSTWEYGIPGDIYLRLQKEKLDRIKAGENPNEVAIWDNITLTDCKLTATTSVHWSELFENILTRPEDVNSTGDAIERTEWIENVEKLQSKLSKTSYAATAEDIDFIKSIHTWMRGVVQAREE